MIGNQHEATRRRLPELAEGEVLRDERERLENHLAGCSSCREELSALVDTLGMLHALPHPKAPPDLAARVRSRIRRRSAMVQRRETVEHRIETTSAATVMIALLVVIGTRLAIPTPEHVEAAEGSGPRVESSDRGAEPTSLFEIREVEASEAHAILSRAALAGATDTEGDPIFVPAAGEALAAGVHELWVAREDLRHVLVAGEASSPAATGYQAPPSEIAKESEAPAEARPEPASRILLRMQVR